MAAERRTAHRRETFRTVTDEISKALMPVRKASGELGDLDLLLTKVALLSRTRLVLTGRV